MKQEEKYKKRIVWRYFVEDKNSNAKKDPLFHSINCGKVHLFSRYD
jgi:hypothetical protein